MAAAKKGRGLGKGLDALFGDVEVSLQRPAAGDQPQVHEDINNITAAKDRKDGASSGSHKADKKSDENSFSEAGGITYIDINDIKPNTNQPRKTFDEEKLEELAASIEAHGLIQPLVLRKAEKGYEIVAGERRWRASRLIGIKEIPCIIRELTDEENMLLAIIENMQREDLNPIEEAEGLRQMIDTYGLTQEQVSKSVGKSRPYIANSLRLLKLPAAIIQFVSDGELSAGHAKVLAGLEDEKTQTLLAEESIKKSLSVRQLEHLLRQDKAKGKSVARVKVKNANVKKVEDDLKEALGTKVTLNQNKKGNKGKIEIEFYSKDELERLIELLKKLG